jgi:hypothetical protein
MFFGMLSMLNSSAPNYFSTNRGSEGGVYLKYIVEHYHDFPDIAIFVHANPEEHQKDWLQIVGCISPTAQYININFQNHCRKTNNW